MEEDKRRGFKRILVVGGGHSIGKMYADRILTSESVFKEMVGVEPSTLPNMEPKPNRFSTLIKPMKEEWVDPNKVEFNNKKHVQTCAKNRRKRKKKRRK